MTAGLDDVVHNRPILVAGAHRTGTTWVGKMLSAGGEAAYISEPLNVLHHPGLLNIPIRYWYTYICAENEREYLPALQELLGFNYQVWAGLKSVHSRKDFLRIGRDNWTFLQGKIRHQLPLLKDPFASFSIPWFLQKLGCQVVVTVRHPAAFASSLKRLTWPFQFCDLIDQPLLMRDWLEPYREDIESLLGEERRTGQVDIISQASLLWRIVYAVLIHFRQKFPEIHIVRHEDLSLDPVTGYKTLYKALGLNFTPAAQKIILESSSSDNPKEASSQNAFDVKVDSRANLEIWKRRLSTQEILRIREITEDIAAVYYPDLDWDYSP